MSIHELILRKGITTEVLKIVNALLDDEMYTKEHCINDLMKMLRKNDLIDEVVEIDELKQMKSTAENKK